MIARTPTPRPILLLLLCAVSPLAYGFQRSDETAVLAERNEAIEQVKRIVNDPVPALPRTPDAAVGMFSPGWFHEGAGRPNFLTVDVRRTQQFPYDQYEYVTSDLNPGFMFRGRDLEFNAMTKFFYTDRSTPKKRLGPAEMEEINRLYRIIGAREQDLARLRSAQAPGGTPDGSAEQQRPTALYLAAVGLLVMLAIAGRLRTSGKGGRRADQ